MKFELKVRALSYVKQFFVGFVLISLIGQLSK